MQAGPSLDILGFRAATGEKSPRADFLHHTQVDAPCPSPDGPCAWPTSASVPEQGRQVEQVPVLPGLGSAGLLSGPSPTSPRNPGQRGSEGPTAGGTDLHQGGPGVSWGPAGALG